MRLKIHHWLSERRERDEARKAPFEAAEAGTTKPSI
jgi:hypothetical protein